MPSFIGTYKIVNNSGTLNNGDNFVTSPTSSSKTFNGSGSEVTGDLSATFSFLSLVLTNDPNVVDDSPSKTATGT